MSDNNKRIELGANTFFQLGTENVIPNDGNAYAMIRSKGHKQATKFVKIEENQGAAYTGTKPIEVNGHDIDLTIDEKLLQVTPEGKLTVNLDEVSGELTDKLNVDATNLSDVGKENIRKLVDADTNASIDPDKVVTLADEQTITGIKHFDNDVMCGNKMAITDHNGYSLLRSTTEGVCNVSSYNYATTLYQGRTHQWQTHTMANGKPVLDDYFYNLMGGELRRFKTSSNGAESYVVLDKANIDKNLPNRLLVGETQKALSTISDDADTATIIAKINELIALLIDRGVAKA